jgi:uncharacterized protein with HEPN domain
MDGRKRPRRSPKDYFEMASRETLDLEPGVPWKQVVLMRHVLVHDYYRIDVPTVWSTVTNDLGTLKQAVVRMLAVLLLAP